MKNRSRSIVWMVLLTIIIFISHELQAQKHTIKFATLAPDGSTWMNIMREFDQELREKTNGEVGFRFFDYFGEKLVELTKIPEKAKVLDVASGRGASLFPSSKKVGNNGSVIGIDISEGMVQKTTEEIIKRGISNIKMMQMDAENLKFQNHTMQFSDYMVAFSGLSKSYCVSVVDMVNSTKISAEMNEISWSKYYEIFLNSMARILPRFGGFVIKNQGVKPPTRDFPGRNHGPGFDKRCRRARGGPPACSPGQSW